MLTYNSTLQNQPPFSDGQRAQAMADIRSPSPYGRFGQNHQDVLRALTTNAANAFDMDAYRANSDYALQQQKAQQQLLLAGLQQQADAEQNDRNVANSRLQSMTGFAGNLLGGLFS